MKPTIQSVEAGDVKHHVRGPKDLLLEKSPPDPKNGLTPEETIAGLEDASREMRQVAPGIFNHPRREGHDKCGARMGRCFGAVVNGVCRTCAFDYRRTSGPCGTNGIPRT